MGEEVGGEESILACQCQGEGTQQRAADNNLNKRQITSETLAREEPIRQCYVFIII